MGTRTSHAAQGRVQGVRCEEDVGGWREDAGAGLWSHTGHTLERGCWSLVTLMVDLSPCRGQRGLLLVRSQTRRLCCAGPGSGYMIIYDKCRNTNFYGRLWHERGETQPLGTSGDQTRAAEEF